MAKKRSPEDVVVDYFTNASMERVDMLLAIVRGIVKRRQPVSTRTVATRKRKNTHALAPVEEQAVV